MPDPLASTGHHRAALPFQRIHEIPLEGPVGCSGAVTGTVTAPSRDMFLKQGIAGIRGFLDLATVLTPFLRLNDRTRPKHRTIRVAVWNPETPPTGVSETVTLSNPTLAVGPSHRWAEGRLSLVVEGASIEDITQICVEHDYRWRFRPGSRRGNSFLLEATENPATTRKAS